MTKLSEVKQSVSGLTPKQLQKLDAWLHELLAATESKKLDSTKAKRQVLKKHTTVNKTYQLESVRCGKKNCHCAEGKPHGPYTGLKAAGPGHSMSVRSRPAASGNHNNP